MEPVELRRPLLVAAVLLGGLVLVIELGMAATVALKFGGAVPALQPSDRSTPGIGIAYLAAFDFFLLYSLTQMTLSELISKKIVGRAQGWVGMVISLVALGVLFVMFFLAFGRLVLMVSLLLAPIFGTLAYFALFADFDRGVAAATLGSLLMLKIALAVCALFAHVRMLQNKSFVGLVLVSIGLTMLVAFLHAFPPGFLANIGDSIGALVIVVLAILWALLLLFGSVRAIFKSP